MKIGKARLDDLQPGEGAVQIVPRAFGNATATVVAGADAAGTDAAAMYLARRVPYVWDNARGSFWLERCRRRRLTVFWRRAPAAGRRARRQRELDDVLGDSRTRRWSRST